MKCIAARFMKLNKKLQELKWLIFWLMQRKVFLPLNSTKKLMKNMSKIYWKQLNQKLNYKIQRNWRSWQMNWEVDKKLNWHVTYWIQMENSEDLLWSTWTHFQTKTSDRLITELLSHLFSKIKNIFSSDMYIQFLHFYGYHKII